MALTINHQTNDISATSGSVTIDGAALAVVATVGAVGTYAWLQSNSVDFYVTPGSTYAGSGFYYAGTTAAAWTISATTTAFDDEAADWSTGPGTDDRTSPAGTWRCMGQSSSAATYDYPSSLFLRIS